MLLPSAPTIETRRAAWDALWRRLLQEPAATADDPATDKEPGETDDGGETHEPRPDAPNATPTR
jgi:hypothetical protein